jgi:uncharacterized protein (TIGR00369 family)
MTVPSGFLPEVGTDPAEDHIGPFYLRRSEHDFAAGLLLESRHCNGMGTVHGGILMTLADFALCAHAKFGTSDPHVITVSFTAEFVAGADEGAWLHTESEVVRRTGSLAFVQGRVMDGDRPVLAYSGIGKRLHTRRN